ncbi:MAG: hypothetical protein N3A58_02125 [Spirochaetes bacterium]|nr:hypothetical protein [Spirochaetota bacterium]
MRLINFFKKFNYNKIFKFDNLFIKNMLKKLSYSIIILTILTVYSFLFSYKVLSQETSSEEDIYSEENFDKEFEKQKEEAKKNTFSFLFGGFINYSNNYNFYSDYNNYNSNGLISGNFFGSISFMEILKFYVKYNYSYYIYYFTDNIDKFKNSYQLNNLNLNLSEFFFDYNILPFLFIRVGKQLISWGPSFMWTPVDFINLEKYNFLSSQDTRGGKPGVRMHIPLNKINLFFFWDLYGLDSSSINYDIKKSGLGTRIDFTFSGFEIGLTGYFRKSYEPKIGFDFSGTLFGGTNLSLDIYFEMSYFNGYFIKGIKKAAFPYLVEEILPPLPSLQIVTGISKNFLEDKSLSFSFTFFYNSQGYRIEKIDEVIPLIMVLGKNLSDYFIPFYYGKYYFASSIAKSKLFQNHLNLSLSLYGNLTDNTFILVFSTNIYFGDYPPINIRCSYNFGEEKGEFTYPYNKILTINLNTSINF